MRAAFDYRGRRIDYFDHPYNTTRQNERCVELAIAREWLHDAAVRDGRAVEGLEVGNVLGHYGVPWERRIVDLNEQGDGVENVDVFDVDDTFDWIVSISTIEHVGQDDGWDDPRRAPLAVDYLRSLLRPGGRMLVTAALGWNAALDAALTSGEITADVSSTMRRDVVNDTLDWVYWPGVHWAEYRSVPPGWAAAVWIGEWSA